MAGEADKGISCHGKGSDLKHSRRSVQAASSISITILHRNLRVTWNLRERTNLPLRKTEGFSWAIATAGTIDRFWGDSGCKGHAENGDTA